MKLNLTTVLIALSGFGLVYLIWQSVSKLLKERALARGLQDLLSPKPAEFYNIVSTGNGSNGLSYKTV